MSLIIWRNVCRYLETNMHGLVFRFLKPWDWAFCWDGYANTGLSKYNWAGFTSVVPLFFYFLCEFHINFDLWKEVSYKKMFFVCFYNLWLKIFLSSALSRTSFSSFLILSPFQSVPQGFMVLYGQILFKNSQWVGDMNR